MRSSSHEKIARPAMGRAVAIGRPETDAMVDDTDRLTAAYAFEI